jgi:hypothetical protein
MTRRKSLAFLIAVLGSLLFVGAVLAQAEGDIELIRWTIDAGGRLISGGTYTMMGTVGQPEPGPTVSGGVFVLTSGFWPAGGQAPSTCEKVNAVLISGPTAGPPGGYTFTAVVSPSTATTPISYTWDNGDSGASSPRTLSVGGHKLTVSVSNCGGAAQVSDDHTIDIQAVQPGCTTPLTGVTISGPTIGITNTTYTFTASPQPVGATTPVTYHWSPEPDSGQGTSSAGYAWASDGVKTITLNAQNCGGASSKVHTITIGAGAGYRICLPLIMHTPEKK